MKVIFKFLLLALLLLGVETTMAFVDRAPAPVQFDDNTCNEPPGPGPAE